MAVETKHNLVDDKALLSACLVVLVVVAVVVVTVFFDSVSLAVVVVVVVIRELEDSGSVNVFSSTPSTTGSIATSSSLTS